MTSSLTDPNYRKQAIDQFITNPSLGALTYQACFIIDELNLIDDNSYPYETRHIRDVLLSWAEYIRDQLWEMYNPADPLGIKPGYDFKRVRGLGKLLHHIYADIRYILATSHDKSPPALQSAVRELTKLYLPRDNGTFVCVVRPQWKYNLKYISLTDHLKEEAPLSLIDPKDNLNISDGDDIFRVLWSRRRNKLQPSLQKDLPEAPARYLGIISFPGLDKNDSLLYPLVAHELGHVFDFSYLPPLHNQGGLSRTSKIEKDEVARLIESFYSSMDPEPMARRVDEGWKIVTERTQICLRELISDLLATRMMGLSFFISQAEFLKTVGDWELHFIKGQPLIDLDSGYPNIKLRLSVIYNHLLKDKQPGNLTEFINQQLTTDPDLQTFLLDYLGRWRALLSTPSALIRGTLNRQRKHVKSV